MYNRIFPLIEVAIGRLKGEGVNIDRSIIDIHVLPIMIELIQNPEIQKNHELQEAIYRHIVDFIDRVGSLSAIQIGAYTDRRKYISDLKFSEALNTTKNRHAYIMNEIIRE